MDTPATRCTAMEAGKESRMSGKYTPTSVTAAGVGVAR